MIRVTSNREKSTRQTFRRRTRRSRRPGRRSISSRPRRRRP